MDLKGKRVLVIGGAGLIGSHVVEELIETDAAKVVVYDNFCRGLRENLQTALRDPREQARHLLAIGAALRDEVAV